MSRKQSASVSTEPESFKGKPHVRTLAGLKLQPEEALQYDIVMWLRDYAPQITFHHSPNQLLRTSQLRVFYTALGTLASITDLILWAPNGWEGFLEVKVPGKYAGPEQRHFIAQRLAEGRAAAVVKSVEDVRDFLHAHGIKTREDLFPTQEALF